jgi:SAM-dependent methyltransferase
MPIAALRSYIRSLLAERRFKARYAAFAHLHSKAPKRLPLDWKDRYARLGDDTAGTGFDRHYVYHPAWAARIVRQLAPAEHIDISSTLHFCSMLSAFVPVRFYDYRPADLHLTGLHSDRADLMDLPFADGSLSSLSCMHTVEHIGLGRYGDPLDPDGDLKAIAELQRVTAPGGNLLFVTPVGQPRIQFNAHRVYAHEQVLEAFAGWQLQQFALVPDDARDGGLVVDPPEALLQRQRYGCGCYWFVKPTTA